VTFVDLNADLAEGYGVWQSGDDNAMLDIVTSANLACGFHAGNPVGLARTCRAAAARGVRIGAQVGYFDLAGFGRRQIEVEPDELTADVTYQIGALQALSHAAGTALRYVKPHGALYNTVVTDVEQARAVAEAVHTVDPSLPVLGLAGSAFFDEANRLDRRRGVRRPGLPAGRQAGAPHATRCGTERPGAHRRPCARHGSHRRGHCRRWHSDPDPSGIGLRTW
jgi:5-oxoprolinase (ATP-hydrolysing) subunit A